jgi:hypothetical protein
VIKIKNIFCGALPVLQSLCQLGIFSELQGEILR